MARERERRRISVLIFYGTVVLIGYLAYQIVQPFLVEIGWAVVLAICLDPLQERLRPRLGPTRTAAVLTLLVLLVLFVPIGFAVFALVNEGQQIATHLRGELEQKGGAGAWLHAAWAWLRAKVPVLPTEEEAIAHVSAEVGNLAGFMAARAGGVLKGAAAFVFSLGITLGILFFLLRDSLAFSGRLRQLLPFHSEQNDRMLSLSRDLVSASVSATLAISVAQGIIGGVAFAILGIPGAAVWGLVMGILAFLPLVGATLVWLPAAVWLMLSGSLGKGIALLLVGVVVMGNVDNVVRPLLLSGKSRMNTLVMLISLLGGVSAFGFIGIVLGPLVAAMLTALAESYVAEDAQRSAAGAAPAWTDPASSTTVASEAGAPVIHSTTVAMVPEASLPVVETGQDASPAAPSSSRPASAGDDSEAPVTNAAKDRPT
jgi:predicted PurR-regulated permease PerM